MHGKNTTFYLQHRMNLISAQIFSELHIMVGLEQAQQHLLLSIPFNLLIVGLSVSVKCRCLRMEIVAI
jgi:hypothetical protein